MLPFKTMSLTLNSSLRLRNALFLLAFVLVGCDTAHRNPSVYREISTKVLAEETSNTTLETVRIYNFWASWCTPCIKEIPEFEAFAKRHAEEVSLVFVNLDREEVWDSSVVEAVERLNITHPVWLVEQDVNFDWRFEVAQEWVLPAIPVTLITYKGQRMFFMRSMNEADLEAALLELHNNS